MYCICAKIAVEIGTGDSLLAGSCRLPSLCETIVSRDFIYRKQTTASIGAQRASMTYAQVRVRQALEALLHFQRFLKVHGDSVGTHTGMNVLANVRAQANSRTSIWRDPTLESFSARSHSVTLQRQSGMLTRAFCNDSRQRHPRTPNR